MQRLLHDLSFYYFAVFTMTSSLLFSLFLGFFSFLFFFFSSPFCDGVNSLGILEFESPTHNCSFDFDSSLFIISACMRLVAWLIPRQLSRQPLGTFFARDMLHRQLVGCRGRQTRFCLCLRSIHLRISTKNGMHVVDSVC